MILATVFVASTTADTSASTVQFYKIIDFDNVELGEEIYVHGNIRDISYENERDRFGPDRFGNNLLDNPAYGSGYAILEDLVPVKAGWWHGLDAGLLVADYSHVKPPHDKNMCDFDGIAFKVIREELTPMMRVCVKVGSTKNSGSWIWTADVAQIHVTGKVVEIAFYFDDFRALNKDIGSPLPFVLEDRSWLANNFKVEVSGQSPESYTSGKILINDVYGFIGDYNPYVKGDINGDGSVNDDDLELFDKCYENRIAYDTAIENGIPPKDIVLPHYYPWGDGIHFGYNSIRAADINGDGVVDEKDREMFFDFVKEGDINGDGKINGMDLLLMKQHILDAAGKTLNKGTMAYKAADINGDDKINGMDLLLLKKKILS